MDFDPKWPRTGKSTSPPSNIYLELPLKPFLELPPHYILFILFGTMADYDRRNQSRGDRGDRGDRGGRKRRYRGERARASLQTIANRVDQTMMISIAAPRDADMRNHCLRSSVASC